MRARKNTKIPLLSLLFIAVVVITVGYAAINTVAMEISGKAEAVLPKTVFIKNVQYISDVEANKNDSMIINYVGTTMQSTMVLSETNVNSEIIYKVTVFNNSGERAFFLDVVHLEENYDNEQIMYEILDTGFKLGEVLEDGETKDIYIKFKYNDIDTITNNVLNSYINFKIEKPNILKQVTSEGDYFETVARDSIEKISFELGKVPEVATSTFDASATGDGSIMGYVTDLDNNGLSEITFSSNSVICTGTNPSYLFYNLSKLTSIEFNNFNTSNAVNMTYMFDGCAALSDLDLSKFDTKNVNNMGFMFQKCSSLTSLDLSKFDTSSTTNMKYMFASCAALTDVKISSFDTSKVTNMTYMFDGCAALKTLDVSGFDTSSVSDMGFMFRSCSSITSLDVSGFDTSNVTSMRYMFASCSGLTGLDLINFDTSKVTNMQSMFVGCSNLTSLDLSSFSTNKVTNMRTMFSNCTKLKTIYVRDGFKTDNVTESANMFYKASALVGGNGTKYSSSYIDKTYARIDTHETPGYFSRISVLKTGTELNTLFKSVSGDITSISFECGEPLTSSDSSFDASLNNDESIMGYYSSDDGKLTIISEYCIWGNSDCSKMFSEMTTLDTITFNNFNTSNTVNMSYMFDGCTALSNLDVTGFNTSNVNNMGFMFQKCSSLTSLDLSKFDTSSTTNLKYMFASCATLTDVKISSFDTSKVTTMSYMFDGCTALKALDVSGFDTSSVSDMGFMFRSCSSITSLDVSGFDTRNVTSMRYMFASCSGLTGLDLIKFNTSKVTNMQSMFVGCSNLTSLDLSSFSTNKVTNMKTMFSNCTKLKTIYVRDGFKTDNVTESTNMFYKAPTLVGENGTTYDGSHVDKTYARIDKQETPGYFTKKARILKSDYDSDTFFGMNNKYQIQKISFEKNVLPINYASKFDASLDGDGGITGYVVYTGSMGECVIIFSSDDTIYANPDSSNMFSNFYGLTDLSLGNFDTSKVTNMSNMFASCYATELDLSGFDTSNVTNMPNMFNGNKATSINLSSFDTSNVTDMSNMFNSCNATSLDLSSFNTSKVTNMSDMFRSCGAKSLDLSSFDTSNITTMEAMFMGSGATNLDLSSFNTSNVTSMHWMFWGCSSLENVDVSNFDTSNVTDMSGMFMLCGNLTSLDLANFDTNKVTDTNWMFYECTNLKTIYASDKFVTNNITNSSDMFYSCTSLVGGNGTTYDSNKIDKTYARIDMEGTPGYFTGNMNMLSNNFNNNTFFGYNRANVKEVSFVYNTIPSNYDSSFDASVNGDNSIMGYVTKVDSKNVNIVFASNDTICANSDCSYMFIDVDTLILDNFDTSYVTNMTGMFSECDVATLNLSSFDTSNVTSMKAMFAYCHNLTSLNLSSFDTSNITDMSSMFYDCSSLATLDLSSFDTSNVTNMSGMFDSCTSLASVNMDNFDTSKVEDMSNLFNNCETLTSLDLSSFNTNNVTNMTYMFYGCVNLKTVYVSNQFSTSNVSSDTSMFHNCKAIVGENGTTYDASHRNKTYARIDTEDTPGYFTEKAN